MAGNNFDEPAWSPPQGYPSKLAFVGKTLSRVILRRNQRELFKEMRYFLRELPDHLLSPLTTVLRDLSPDPLPRRKGTEIEKHTREMADLAVLLDGNSPLGQCLRRSLTRYHFLRKIGVPLQVHFGARFVAGEPDREVTGHAWLTLNGEPYYEDSRNWQAFSVMISYPKADKSDRVSGNDF